MSTNDASVIDRLFEQLGGQSIQQLASSLSSTPEQTKQGIQSALPLLLGAAGKKWALPQGVQSLLNALPGQGHQSDPSGQQSQWSVQRLMKMIPGFHHSDQEHGSDQEQTLQSATSKCGTASTEGSESCHSVSAGSNPLQQLLGDQVNHAATQVSQASGLNNQQSMQLLQNLAPMLAKLGQSKWQGQPGEEAKSSAAGVAGHITKALDQDGDGKLGLSDLKKAGSDLFNSSSNSKQTG